MAVVLGLTGVDVKPDGEVAAGELANRQGLQRPRFGL